MGLTIALASVLIPAVFPKEVTLSPLVLFGIVFLTNTVAYLIPEKDARSATMFDRVFFVRLAVSLVLAAVLMAI